MGWQGSIDFLQVVAVRSTAMRPEIVFGPDIAGSLVAELILMPVLFVWMWQAVKQPKA